MKRTGFLTTWFLVCMAVYTSSFATTVQYTFGGVLEPVPGLTESTFMVHLGYDNISGEVSQFEVRLDGGLSPIWASAIPGAELLVQNDVPDYYAPGGGTAGDVFRTGSRVSTVSQLPSAINYEGIGISLTDSSANIFDDASPPLSLSLSSFDGGLVPGYLANYGNALYGIQWIPGAIAGDYILWVEAWSKFGTITSSCDGFVNTCQPVASEVPLPPAVWLFTYGLVGAIAFGQRSVA